ncbi:MAG: AAA family ATPase [Gammaproteobacteria bacterium]|nr:AAA family ATPase [Gammaproteobacteria bacterium]
MYTSYFGLSEIPFSITPDPRYLYLSRRYREAMAHLLFGIQEGGGFVQLTGEVGTGKTTLCRCVLEQLPENIDVALILNPKVDEIELLAAICDELNINYLPHGSTKHLLDRLNAHLLEVHAQGRKTILIVDEAQNLSTEVLEQIRLLTNLETPKQKLLRIILVGQPELVNTLARPGLRQLAQRITARYHLSPLAITETAQYVKHRLAVAGCSRALFQDVALRRVHKLSGGVPRLINAICDRALLGAYSKNKVTVNAAIVKEAAAEVLGTQAKKFTIPTAVWATALLVVVVAPLLWKFSPIFIRFIDPPTKVVAEAKDSAEVALAPTETRDVLETPREEIPPIDSSSQLAIVTIQPEAQQEPPSLAELLADPDIVTDRFAAVRRLLELWGLSLHLEQVKTVCQNSTTVGLGCLEEKGTWNNLRRYNRAAILTLRDMTGSPHYTVLTAIDGEQASLDFDGKVVSFPVAAIDRYWYGDYMMLWRPPPLTKQTVSSRSSGEDVVWLRQAMALLTANDGSAPIADVESPVFDDELHQRILEFQRSQALEADGIVGIETLIQLNAALNPDGIPRLIN